MKYVDICIALYDYQAQSEEELSFSADNILYILENNDPNWYRAQLKASSNEEGPIGLIPSNYIEKIKPIGHVKALYDYDAQSAAEVSFKEDEQMTLYESKDKDWCVVETVQGNIGLAPSNYVEKTTETSTQQTAAAPTAPIAPIAPVSAPSEPDVALSWPVHEYDLKKKRKTKSKGNLLVGNGLLCFGSETDKSSPVRQFPISQIKQTDIDSKVVHIIMDKETLAFQLASQSEAKAVVAKIDASQKAHQPAVNKPPAVDKPLPPLSPTKESKWAVALYAFKPDVDEETYLEEHERVLVTDYDNADWWAVEHKDGTTGIVPANYIQFQEDYEASLKIEEEKKRKLREEEEQRLKDEEENHKKLEEQRKQEEEETRIKQEQEDRLRKEEEARKKLEEEERIKQEEENRKRLEEEAKKKQEEEERKQREEELARKKQEEEERKKREEEERKRREEEELAKKRQEEERLKQEEEARKQREIDERHKEEERQRELAELKRIKEIEQKEKERQTEAERRRRLQDEAIQNELRNKRSSLNSPVVNSPRRSEIPAPPPPVVVPQAHLDSSNPDPSKIRTWTDRTGAFKVQAQFVSCANGKIRLHKMNGVQIDVPVNKMCDEDIHFVEEETDMKLEIEQDEPFSWLEYFKRANLPHDACVEYAGNFEANQLSRRDIEKLTHRQMKMLGMTEKHVQRIQRFIETNQAEPPSDDELTPPKIKKRKSVSFGDVSYIEATPYEEEHDDNVLNQIEEDERLARELQEQEDQEYNRVGLQRRGTGRTYPAPPVPDVSMSPQQLPSQLNTPASSMPAPPSPANAFSNNQSNSGFEDDAWTPRPSPQAPSHWNPPQHTGPSIPPISPQIVDPQYLAKWGGSPALAEANLRPVPAPPTSFTPSPLQQQQSFSSPNISGSSLPQQYNNNMSPTSPMFQQPYPSPLSPQHTNDSTSSVGRNWTNATPENPFGGAPQQPFYIVPPSFGAQQPNQQATTIDPTDKYAVFKNINNPTPSVFNTTRYQ